MGRFTNARGVVFFGCMVLFPICAAVTAQAQPPRPGRTPFDRDDKNSDGRLSRDEFKGPAAAFDSIDTDGDGYISRDEASRSRQGGPRFRESAQGQENSAAPKAKSGRNLMPLIDIHSHLNAISRSRSGQKRENTGAVEAAKEAMARYNIKKMIMMPPPFPPGHQQSYEVDDFSGIAAKHLGRFAFMGGGGTLNVMIQQAVAEGGASDKLKRQFAAKARDLLKQGAVGFGEFAVEHLCLGETHNHQDAPADHPLFLLLADIAAERGVPIDLHMEAVGADMLLPRNLKSPPNPKRLKANVAGLERLLAHNRKAKIIWSHVGWDNTGQRTIAMTERLLKDHENLYMSFKISPKDSLPETRPLESGSTIKPEWLELMNRYPDRFTIGMDQFFVPPGKRSIGPRSLEPTMEFFRQLPDDLARKIGYENAARLFNLAEVESPARTKSAQ